MSKTSWALVLGTLWVGSSPERLTVAQDSEKHRTLKAFFVQHCLKCHGTEKPKGKFSLSALDSNIAKGKDVERWKAVAERLALAEMPPESEPRPDARTVSQILEILRTELSKGGETLADVERKLHLPGHGNRVDHDALFSGAFTGPAASPSRLWRMSPQIYSALIPRITGQKGKSSRVSQAFSISAGAGFKDYADLFQIDEPTLTQLLRNAQEIVEIQTSKGNGGKPVREFMPLVDPDRAASPEEIRVAIRREFQMAILRDPSSEELARLEKLYDKTAKDAGRATAAKSTLTAILMLPEAMYRAELGSGTADASGRRVLAPRELAFAIGFALTDEGPDAALLKAADSGKLATREDVRREVQRLLADSKVQKPRIMRFFEEYFEYPTAIEVFKDIKRGQWRPEVLINDTRLLIQAVLDEDKDVLRQLLSTNKSFVNFKLSPKGGAEPARIANKPDPNPKPGAKPKAREMEIWDLYGLPEDWTWTEKQPIELPRDQRAGILTQPSWLAAFATNDENHAIRRGKWIRERLLGGVVPDLPITVDAQLPDAPDKSLRERMEVTKKEYCWQCHRKMNPLGLSFEMFDYLGRHRTSETVVDPVATAALPKKGKEPVTHQIALDSTGLLEMSGESRLDGPVASGVDLIRKLAESPRVRQVFVRHAFRYWMGRNETLTDSPTLIAADRAYVDSGGSMKALVISLLSSDSFLYRWDPKPLLRPSAGK